MNTQGKVRHGMLPSLSQTDLPGVSLNSEISVLQPHGSYDRKFKQTRNINSTTFCGSLSKLPAHSRGLVIKFGSFELLSNFLNYSLHVHFWDTLSEPSKLPWNQQLLLTRDSVEWSKCRRCSEGLAYILCLLVCIVLFPIAWCYACAS